MGVNHSIPQEAPRAAEILPAYLEGVVKNTPESYEEIQTYDGSLFTHPHDYLGPQGQVLEEAPSPDVIRFSPTRLCHNMALARAEQRPGPQSPEGVLTVAALYEQLRTPQDILRIKAAAIATRIIVRQCLEETESQCLLYHAGDSCVAISLRGDTLQGRQVNNALLQWGIFPEQLYVAGKWEEARRRVSETQHDPDSDIYVKALTLYNARLRHLGSIIQIISVLRF